MFNMKIGLKIFASALLLAVIPAKSFAAESGLQPSFSLSEEYNDNVLGTSENEKEDYITRVLPGFSGYYRGSRVSLEGAYLLDFNYYAKNTRASTAAHKLHFQSSAEFLKNTGFLRISDTYDKVSVDPTRSRSQESTFLGQTDSNTFSVEPYFTFRPGSLLSVNAGYTYINTWYRGEGNADKRDHVFFLRSDIELSGLDTVNVSVEHLKENGRFLDFEKDDIYTGYKHVFAQGSDISASIGLSRFTPEEGKAYENIFWRAGLNHDFDIFALTLSTSASLNENPQSTPQWDYTYLASLGRKFARSEASLGLVLTDYKDGETEALKTRKYGATVNFKREMTSRVNSAFSVTVEKFELKQLKTYTRRFFFTASADYRFTETLSASLVYNFIDMYSPEIQVDNYTTNRVIAELRKTF